jgi:hypothetical protein
VVNAAIAADSKDEMDSDLDDLKDKLGLPYLPENLIADIVDLNLAKTKLPKSAPWILDSGASTSLTGDASAIKNLKHVDTKVHVTTTGGQSHPVGSVADHGLHIVFVKDCHYLRYVSESFRTLSSRPKNRPLSVSHRPIHC